MARKTRKNYKITQTPPPVTVFYSGRGVLPKRAVVYRKVYPVRGQDRNLVGRITYCGQAIRVARTQLENGRFSEWAAIDNTVNLFGTYAVSR